VKPKFSLGAPGGGIFWLDAMLKGPVGNSRVGRQSNV